MKTDFKPTITPKSAAQKLFEYQKKKVQNQLTTKISSITLKGPRLNIGGCGPKAIEPINYNNICKFVK